MVNVDSSRISWQRPGTGESGDLSESMIDNGFVAQNLEFDYLLDMAGQIAQPAAGEIFVPVAYRTQFGLVEGDEVVVQSAGAHFDFEVAGFVRDAQMASSMSSSTRFLVSDQDFAAMTASDVGSPEAIIEFRLTDPGSAAAFQQAYENPDVGLPKNGPAVTFAMIRLLNALSEGLVAAALMLVATLLIVLAMVNLRFVIMGTLTDEVSQIGAMKAIGLPNQEIRAIYLNKYRVLALLGCLFGGLAAVGASSALTRSLQVNYSSAPLGWLSIVAPLVALVVVYGVVMAICHSILRRVDRVSVVNALVHGSMLTDRQIARSAASQSRQARRVGLSRHRSQGINVRLATTDLLAEARSWTLLPIVFALATIVVTLPTNLLSTFQSPGIVDLMGTTRADLLVGVQQSPRMAEVHDQLLAEFADDPQVTNVRDYANVLYQVETPDGWETLRVETGDYSSSTIDFISGAAPAPGEIALSAFNADHLGVGAGERITLRGDDGVPHLVLVSGIYQDITNGGFTSKYAITNPGAQATSYAIYADVTGGAGAEQIVDRYREAYPDAKFTPVQSYVAQTLSYVTDAFRSATLLAVGLGLGIAVLLTSLFLRLTLTRDRPKMGVLHAIGFSSAEIGRQYLLKTVGMVCLGVAIGLTFSELAGEPIVSTLLSASGLGLRQLHFITNPAVSLGVIPLALIGTGVVSVLAATAGLRRIDKSAWLRSA